MSDLDDTAARIPVAGERECEVLVGTLLRRGGAILRIERPVVEDGGRAPLRWAEADIVA